MSSLLLLNGSPRGPRSNSMRMLTRVANGWEAQGGMAPTVLSLALPSDFKRAVAEFAQFDCVMLGMPLYTDAMPGVVAELFEALEPRIGHADNPRIGFLVQSGFSEALHSRHLERYFEKLARRLGCEYAGTIIRGGGEGLQMMPDEACKKLYAQLEALGAQLSSTGHFAEQSLREIARTERYSPLQTALMSAAVKLPVAQHYWNSQLRKNGAWEKRWARPYVAG